MATNFISSTVIVPSFSLGNSLVEVIHRRVEILRAHVEEQVRVGAPQM
jgi:hypothetical protein